MSRFIDSLRELLLPTLALTILATLWVVAKARNGDDDLARGMAARAPWELLEKIKNTPTDDDNGDDRDTNAPVRSTAQADTGPAVHH